MVLSSLLVRDDVDDSSPVVSSFADDFLDDFLDDFGDFVVVVAEDLLLLYIFLASTIACL